MTNAPNPFPAVARLGARAADYSGAATQTARYDLSLPGPHWLRQCFQCAVGRFVHQALNERRHSDRRLTRWLSRLWRSSATPRAQACLVARERQSHILIRRRWSLLLSLQTATASRIGPARELKEIGSRSSHRQNSLPTLMLPRVSREGPRPFCRCFARPLG